MSTRSTVAGTSKLSAEQLFEALRRSELLDEPELRQWRERASGITSGKELATQLIKAGLLSRFQANRLLEGKSRGFIIGPYRIQDLLSEGNKDVIYLAEHRAMSRQVTIKVLKQNIEQTKDSQERFIREARITSALNHPNIVKLYDFVEQNGTQYLVMEYITGKTLKEMLIENGPLPLSQALDYARQIAQGLQHAHSQGIIHRDIKPSSLIVDTKGVVKILDMGHCRFSDDQQMNITKMYDPTKVVGSVEYVAPEQALGEQYDERCDLYSLGATLFALITGRAPFQGTSYQILMAHQVDNVPEMTLFQPRVTPPIQAFVVKLMAKIPQQRYQTAAEVITVIQQLKGMATSSKVPALPQKATQHDPSDLTIELPAPVPIAQVPMPITKAERRRRETKQSKLEWIITGCIVATIVIGLVLYWLSKATEPATQTL